MAARLAGRRLALPRPRGSWLRVVAGVVVGAYMLVGASLLHEKLDQRSLSSQIDSAHGVLTSSGEARSGLDELPAQIEAAQAALDGALEAFPLEVDGNRVLARAVELAELSGARVAGSTALESEAGDADVQPALRLELEVEGSVNSLLAFLAAFEDDDASASTRTESFVLQVGEDRATLTLGLALFARPRVAPEEAAQPRETERS